MKYQEKELECIFCDRGFRMDEIFVCYCNDSDTVIVSMCIPCAESHPNSKKEEKGYWCAVERNLGGYEIQPIKEKRF